MQAERNSTDSTNRWAFFLHLSQLLGLVLPVIGFLAPVVIWKLHKDDHPDLTQHFRAVMNWIISVFVYLAVSALLLLKMLPALFLFFLFVLILFVVVFALSGAMKADRGILWPYPLAIQFLKMEQPIRG